MTARIAVALGDGIGPEVMGSALEILAACGAPLDLVEVDPGCVHRRRGVWTGHADAARREVEACGILFQGPMVPPRRGGTVLDDRSATTGWGTFANKRVFRALALPSVRHVDLDLTLIREICSPPPVAVPPATLPFARIDAASGPERLIRYAFRVARRKGARHITCGYDSGFEERAHRFFPDAFRSVAREFPEIDTDVRPLHALATHLVLAPSAYDVVVVPDSPRSDILAALCAGLAGGTAYAPSADMGPRVCVFGPGHGTAPDLAGTGIANPTAQILAGCMMLRHLALLPWADRVEDAVRAALREIHRPRDLCVPPLPFSTRRFTDLVLGALQDRGPVAAARCAVAAPGVAPRGQVLRMSRPRHSNSRATSSAWDDRPPPTPSAST